ncbi:DUF4126 domain-containing protein [Homoserinibacter sp. YIM 151385]|uniref:DUF4126 domain-containing protein n=1 Tax=Homoserinibacter sp. YIM 151385 TaxID=2985506 RepID=UPI0022F0DBB2|nr:DUF4126 domain-containing protein [Homoserinibacter sp. YIM 151385]WBU38616.1 DUF4126 domain-containing protein [Homoserinibacter sp. YIM 151385]
MLELLTGTGLAAAAGLNAYVPMLILGLASRFTEVVNLPAGWLWLENGWVQLVLGVLLVIEVVADKVPAVDSINDWLQTIVRPAAGGIVFGSGAGAQTAVVEDPAAFVERGEWVPIVIGILIALLVHGGKALVRPAANAMTAGVAAPVLSTIEDAGSIGFSIAALVAPVLVLLGLGGLLAGFIVLARRRRLARERRRADRAMRDRPSVGA